MTISLRSMTSEEFPDFLARTRAERVDDMVKIGAGTHESLASSTDAFIAELFPDGVASSDNVLFTAVEGDRAVGYLWLRETDGVWGVWWVFVREEDRRRGIGRHVMLLAEDEVRSHGGVEMRLNVYAHNPGARALYEQLGYEPTATQMRKIL